MGRESQAARPEPGRDDQAGSSGQALHRSPWLHQEGVGHRGYCPLLERKPRQRAEVLPHPGPELCLDQAGRRQQGQGWRASVQRSDRRLRQDPEVDGIQGIYRGFTISAVGIFIYRGMYFGMFDTLKPTLIGGKDSSVVASFLLGWAVTVTAGLMSYPIDTIRRRMMMTSGGGAKYKGSIDCAMQIMKNECFMSMMKGAGANILRGVAGAGVLAGFDKFQAMYIAWRTSL